METTLFNSTSPHCLNNSTASDLPSATTQHDNSDPINCSLQFSDLNLKATVLRNPTSRYQLTEKQQEQRRDSEVGTDSEEAPPERLRFQSIQFGDDQLSEQEPPAANVLEDEAKYSTITSGFSLNNIQIPIVGFEIIEERARFTVFKLRVENKASGDCWYVFRRYTDFGRLCKKLKRRYPQLGAHLPRKRWLGDNFESSFLEQRATALQSLVDAILAETDLTANDDEAHALQDFFCLNEPPLYSEANEESRAIFEALEDTIYQLKQQIQDKENVIDRLHESLQVKSSENDNLRKFLHESTINCTTCKATFENFKKKSAPVTRNSLNTSNDATS